MSHRQQWIWCAIATALLGVSATLAGTPLGTAFTYQGQLKEDGVPVNDPAREMWFRLYDTSLGGFPVGGMLPAGVRIDKGLFTVQLDFGINAFDGNKRWLEIDVLKPGVGYFTLSPRQEITATPYAAYAPRAAYANDADSLDGQHGSFYQDASNLTSGTLSEDRLPQNAIDSSEIENDSILDEDISPTAAIAPSKISGTALTYANDGYPPRAGYNAPSGFMTTSDTYQIVTSVTINLPTDGYVFALASAAAGYWTGPYEGTFALGFGSTTADQPSERWVKMPNADHEQSVSTATMHWMEAGPQTVYLLIKRDSGTGPIWFGRSTLSVIFFDDLSKVQTLNAATRAPEPLHRPVDRVRQ